MQKRSIHLSRLRLIILMAFVVSATVSLFLITPSLAGKENSRADIIVIDGMKQFGKLERSAVIFLHDLHTDALEAEGKDCQTCHLKAASGGRTLKFKRIQDTARETTMEIYHRECMACHKTNLKADKKTGPIEVCKDCHLEKTDLQSSRKLLSFNRTLHEQHNDAVENCGACHHKFKPDTGKMYFPDSTESTCRFCHRQSTEQNRISMKLAAHLNCIGCHQQEEAGPLQCAECHEPDV